MSAEYVSVTPDALSSGNAPSFDSSVSGDGHLVAFSSQSTDLIGGFADNNGADGTDVFVRNTTTGVTTLVSHGAGGATAGGDGSSGHAAVSADGRFVAFESTATDVSAQAGDAKSDVFLYNVATGAIVLVSATAGGAPGNNASTAPSVSADGRFVAFQTQSTDLAAGGGNPAVVLRDTTAGTSVLASVWSDGSPIADAAAPSVSDDGARVAFTTTAVGPGVADANAVADVYVRNLAAGTTTLVSHAAAGTAGSGASTNPAISGNGATVAFQSLASDLVVGDDPAGTSDVFAYSVASGGLTLVSATAAGIPGAGDSTDPAVTADGTSVAFISAAGDLLAGSNNSTDAYVRTLGTGELILLGGDLDGSISNGAATNPDISADGQWVTFDSIGTRLDPDTNESEVGDPTDMDVFETPRVAFVPPPDVTPTDPGPDLTVATVAQDVGQTAEGPAVTTVSALVANAGDVDAGAFDVRFALSADPVYDDADTELAVVPVGGLAAGASLSVSAGDPAAPAGLVNGEYYIVARADAAGAVTESVETNNDGATDTPVFAVTTGADAGDPTNPPGSDALTNLVAGPLTVKLKSPSVVAGSKAPKATFPVTNGGTGPIDVTVAVRVVASLDGTVDAGDTDVATFDAVRIKLKAGKTKVLKLNLAAFPSPPDGQYFLLAEVDSQNVLDETNEADNVGSTAAPVTIAAPFVDIRPATASLGAAPATLLPNRKVSFKVTLTNPGNIDLKATTQANLNASADTTLGAGDTNLSIRSLKLSLKPGQTKTYKLTFALPDTLPTGDSYFLALQLDATNVVIEQNEGDNGLVADNATTTA